MVDRWDRRCYHGNNQKGKENLIVLSWVIPFEGPSSNLSPENTSSGMSSIVDFCLVGGPTPDLV